MQKNNTVSLLVDEVHQKPVFDHKGGNIVGLSDNSNEAATSAFAFMLSSVFLQYNDVVHIMLTIYLLAENFFGGVKHIIISIEEIGFQELSIITENNAINKVISFFYFPLNLSIVYLHSVTKSTSLFFLFDSVLLLKCIRNKDASKCMLFSKFCHNRNHEYPKCPILYRTKIS